MSHWIEQIESLLLPMAMGIRRGSADRAVLGLSFLLDSAFRIPSKIQKYKTYKVKKEILSLFRNSEFLKNIFK